MRKPNKKEEALNYETAVFELSQIQQDLEQNEIPIEALTEKVKRANYLLQWCREKLRNTESELEVLMQHNEE